MTQCLVAGVVHGRIPAVTLFRPHAKLGAFRRCADVFDQAEFTAHVVNAVASNVAWVAHPGGGANCDKRSVYFSMSWNNSARSVIDVYAKILSCPLHS